VTVLSTARAHLAKAEENLEDAEAAIRQAEKLVDAACSLLR
jgi:hypothetical protein